MFPEKYLLQIEEWNKIAEAMIAAGQNPIAFEVSKEQKRLYDFLGERLITNKEYYELIFLSEITKILES